LPLATGFLIIKVPFEHFVEINVANHGIKNKIGVDLGELVIHVAMFNIWVPFKLNIKWKTQGWNSI